MKDPRTKTSESVRVPKSRSQTKCRTSIRRQKLARYRHHRKQSKTQAQTYFRAKNIANGILPIQEAEMKNEKSCKRSVIKLYPVDHSQAESICNELSHCGLTDGSVELFYGESYEACTKDTVKKTMIQFWVTEANKEQAIDFSKKLAKGATLKIFRRVI